MGRHEVPVFRRVEESVRRLSVLRRKLDGFGNGEVARVYIQVTGAPQDLASDGGWVQPHYAGGLRRRASEEEYTRGCFTLSFCRTHVGDARVRRLQGSQCAAIRVEDREVRASALLERANDAPGRDEGVGRHPEGPLRRTELRLRLVERLDRPLPPAVEVPPARPVRDEVERSFGGPLRLEDGFVLAAGDPLDVLGEPFGVEITGQELRTVPGHVRMVPRQPRQPQAARAQTW